MNKKDKNVIQNMVAIEGINAMTVLLNTLLDDSLTLDKQCIRMLKEVGNKAQKIVYRSVIKEALNGNPSKQFFD